MQRQKRTIALIAFIAMATGCTAQIAQPAIEDLPIASEDERVDLAVPDFPDPTRIDNPLFPISGQASVLLLGTVDDLPFRTEVTLLPRTRIIEWEGRPVETLVSQYVAFSGGRINEVAYDYYAQAEDGSVWYFGEDVFDFADGAIVDTHGTWMAGLGGPACMIMPAHPQVGDVYRPENMPGVVFEEVMVEAVDQTLDGPLGPVEGGIVVRELHMDGATEDKQFAPAYGEFYTSDGTDTEALALAVPIDAANGPVPDQLAELETSAHEVEEMGEAEDWPAATASVEAMQRAWADYASGDVPALVRPAMDDAMAALGDGVAAEDAPGTIGAAIEVARLSLDLQLRYRPVPEVDLQRLGLWSRQMMLDAGQEELEAVNGDLFSMDYVRDRDLGLSDEQNTRLNYILEELQALIADEDLAGVEETADQVEDLVAEASGG